MGLEGLPKGICRSLIDFRSERDFEGDFEVGTLVETGRIFSRDSEEVGIILGLF